MHELLKLKLQIINTTTTNVSQCHRNYALPARMSATFQQTNRKYFTLKTTITTTDKIATYFSTMNCQCISQCTVYQEYHKYVFLINNWRRSFEAQNHTVATLFTHMNEINIQILNDEETSNEPEACYLYQSCESQHTTHSTHCSLVMMHHLVQLSTHNIITLNGSWKTYKKMIITGRRCSISCDFGIIYKHPTNQLLINFFS